MHVEVNEVNIAVYELVRFTGNSKEVLLENAKQAKKNGHILYCQIPDKNDRPVNVFDAFAVPENEEALETSETVMVEKDSEGNAVRIDIEGAEMIDGEIVEEGNDA